MCVEVRVSVEMRERGHCALLGSNVAKLVYYISREYNISSMKQLIEDQNKEVFLCRCQCKRALILVLSKMVVCYRFTLSMESLDRKRG